MASFTLSAIGINVALDLAVGHISAFTVTRDGRNISPFHQAPWRNDPLDASIPPQLKSLSIDFFCAPFGKSDLEPAPPHGWSANSRWELDNVEQLMDGTRATFRLQRPILSATLRKTLTVRDGHPFLYQTHRFEGGAGRLPVACHTMVDLPNGGLLSVSPKMRAETMPDSVEPDPAKGRSVLAYPATSADLHIFPRADGGRSDLLKYPLDDGHVDFVMLHEQPSNSFGWSAAARPAERDMALVLKPAGMLPSTVLWYSNGGRFPPPWNGRHRGVLGIEDACTFFNYGHNASIASNALSAAGIATSLLLPMAEDIRTVIGASEILADGTVSSIDIIEDALRITKDRAVLDLPFDGTFLNTKCAQQS